MSQKGERKIRLVSDVMKEELAKMPAPGPISRDYEDDPATDRSTRTAASEDAQSPGVKTAVSWTSNVGEKLEICSDDEWKEATPAYNSTLLNIKKNPERPLVFAAPEVKRMTVETVVDTTQGSSISEQANKSKSDEKLSAIGRLVTEVARAVLGSNNDDAEVEITVRIKDKLKKVV